MINCRTPALGAEIFASTNNEEKGEGQASRARCNKPPRTLPTCYVHRHLISPFSK
jgi:hypothetical protein